MPERVAVSSAEFIRNIGYWQSEALRRPVSITHHGRERLVLASLDRFNALANVEAAHGLDELLANLRAGQTALLENLDDGFIQFDSHLQIKAVNAVAETYVGRSREQLMEKTVFEAFPERLAALCLSYLQRALRTRKAESFDTVAFGASYLVLRVFPMTEGVGLFFRNTTETERLKREHEECDALNSASAQHDHIAVIKLDARGRIETANDNFCRCAGFGENEIIGYRLIDLVSGGRRRDIGSTLERVLTERKSERVPLTIVGKKGGETSGEIAFAPIIADFAARGVLGVWLASLGAVSDTDALLR